MYVQTNVGLLCFVGSGSKVPTVKDVGSRPLACWDCGFATRRGRGCWSVVSAVCYQEEFLQQTNHSSKGIVPRVVRLNVIEETHGGSLGLPGLSRQE